MRRILPRSARFARLYTTAADESARVDYEARKSVISRDTGRYYPSVSTTRDHNATVVRIDQFNRQFAGTDYRKLSRNMDTTNLVTVEGRIESIRKSGRGMYFIDVVQDGCKLQLVVNNKLMGLSKDEFDDIHSFFRKGDLVSTKGYPGVTNVGELSLKLSSPIVVLSPRLCQVPNKLSDKRIINSNRVMNYLVNPTSKDPVIAKSKIIQAIRNFLLEKQFLEVTTPILAGSGTGANARPFVTQFHGSGVHLRVAPELWLKKMVIGGFEKIFEIGQNFRNEGVDATHNPEFTSCEFYQTYTSLDQLMELTEEMFSKVHSDLSSSFYLDHLSCFQDKYPKFEFIPTLEEKTGRKLPATINSETLQQYYRDIGVEIPENKSASSLLDNLSGMYLESISEEIEYANTPVFIYNQPEVLSPLAKSAKKDYNGREYAISRRFELFINGKEYVNAYEEENDPAVQLKKFNEQQQAKTDFNDAESLVPDWQFVSVMEYGLPPTGGWGCGIDRLAMLFSGADRIDEVLPFGNLRDVQKQ